MSESTITLRHRALIVVFAHLVLAIVAFLGACVSQRQDVTGPGAFEGECRIPVGSSLIGGTQALVAIRGYAFVRDTVRVKPGTTVTWINCESAEIEDHTTTSDDALWDSPFLASGATYSRTFTEVGHFPYHCVPHEFMRAVIVVEE
jgi:plastocyanin